MPGCGCGGSAPPVVQSQQAPAQPGAPRSAHVRWEQAGVELDHTYSPPREVPVYREAPSEVAG